MPRQPTTVLGWTMRKLRKATGWTISRTAQGFGCSPSHISRVEHGAKPSRELVQFYEDQFEAEGMLLSLFEVAEQSAEHDRRRRAGGHDPRLVRATEGDATAFVDDTIPHGTLMAPGERFVKTWRIRNAGTVPWRARRLERQGPRTGPGLITSPRYVAIPDTDPGDIARVSVQLKAPGYDCTSIAYFKMIDERGYFCFPDIHQLGLDVLVRVERNTLGIQ